MRRLIEAIPEFGQELAVLLSDAERPDLIPQVSGLEIVERCRCGDDFCATFYTAPPPKGAWGEGHCTITLSPGSGMVNLDLVFDRIVSVEVLYRPDVRKLLFAAVP
jgi:hypothetical protein